MGTRLDQIASVMDTYLQASQSAFAARRAE
jgi:hypothetical protein